MTSEMVKSLAREAGGYSTSFNGRWTFAMPDVERLAALVAAAEREACARTVERARLQIDGRHGVTSETDFIATRIIDFLAGQIRERQA